MYVIVITDAKADFDNFTLEKHHQLTRDRMLKKTKNPSATEPVPLTIDGHPALHFQQILAWKRKSRWGEQNQLLREIAESFRSEK